MSTTVYIETSVISYYTAKPSRDLEEINNKLNIKTPILCIFEELMEV